MNRPKRLGTEAETGLATFLAAKWWPYAERRSLSGALDKGDITGTPGLCWEQKNCSVLKITQWLREAETERVNSKSDFGIVVSKPTGVGYARVAAWHAMMWATDLERLFGQATIPPHQTYYLDRTTRQGDLMFDLKVANSPSTTALFPVVRYQPKKGIPRYAVMYLNQMTDLLNRAGYGTQ